MGRFKATTNAEISEREKVNKERAKAIARESVVLLENDGTLPMNSAGKLALFGSGARATVKGGTGSGNVNSRSVVNIEQGFEAAGYEVLTKDWLDRFDEIKKCDKEAFIAWTEKRAEEKGTYPGFVAMCEGSEESKPAKLVESDLVPADLAVYVLARNSGEGCDRKEGRGDYMLFEEEKEIIETLAKKYEKFVVVLNIGGVMDMSELRSIEGINAIILLGQLGNITGEVLPEVILGKVNPSGRLADTWAKNYEDYASSSTFSHVNGNVNEEMYTDGVYVGYRYFDTFKKAVIYPFGYGLSYTEFELETRGSGIEGTKVEVCVQVKNIGQFSGKEVVQLYVQKAKGKFDKPIKELIAFAKTGEIKPGESEDVMLYFDVRDMASFCEKCSAWVLHKGSYRMLVGTNAGDVTEAFVINMPEMKKTKICKRMYEKPEILSELKSSNVLKEGEEAELFEDEDGHFIIEISPSVIETEKYSYTTERQSVGLDFGALAETIDGAEASQVTLEDILAGEATVEDMVAQLTTAELASLAAGKFQFTDKEKNLVGNASIGVPGAAGDTSHIIENRGVRSIVTADGPAGLRLQPIFKTDLDGKLLPGGETFEDMVIPFAEELDDSNSITHYQYCTAIPIAWSLAMTWNVDALKDAGDIVGGEMEEFGVDLWLAPGMNIHRNPICGRNFEYYSEDPFLTGMCAAAITKGVQQHKGKGTTVKHYVANNQEDNRFFVNNIMSDRTLREIYLRGFEICVREANPKALMTSYNLINGTHTSNSFELVQNILKDEWGYKGLVMSDWCTTIDFPQQYYLYDSPYPKSSPAGCVKAGNDLIMPGCPEDVSDIFDAVTSGVANEGFTITLADLQATAATLIRTVVEIEKALR